MEDIIQRFNDAKGEFLRSNASKKIIEQLYDIIYNLKDRERTYEENYILACIYELLGERIHATEVVEQGLLVASDEENLRLWELLEYIRNQDSYRKKYRDLREAKASKNMPTLSEFDFIHSDDIDHGHRKVTLHEKIISIVVLNKYLRANCVSICVSDKIKDYSVGEIIGELEWLANLKSDLLIFYNNSTFDYRLDHVDENWFDGLEVIDLLIEVNSNGGILMEVTVYDYLQNDFGFILSTEDRTIKSIEYDPIL